MKVKNSIKKVGAVAGSALMVGLSVGAAASLSDFPEPFVEDGDVASQVVVGSSGQVADVVGAVNIAAALGQDAIQTEERETPGTGASVDVDGDTGETSVRDDFDFSVGDEYSGFHFFEEYDEDDGLSVIEDAELTTSSTGSVVSSDEEPELGAEVRLAMDSSDLTYTADYVPSVEEGESIYLLGETWGVTSVNSGDIEIGDQMEHRNLAAGDEIEHGDWTVEIIDVDREDNKVRLDIYEDGDFVTSKTLAEDSTDGDVEDTFGDDDEFKIEVDDIWFGDALDQVHLDTTLTTEELEHGEPFFADEDWEVRTSTSNGEVESVSLVNINEYVVVEDDDDAELDDEQMHALSPGDSIMGPNDYFEVENLGLEAEDNTEEEIVFADELGLEFTDHNNVETSLNVEEDILHDSNLDDGDEGYLLVQSDDVSDADTLGGNTVSPGVPVYVNVDTWETESGPNDVTAVDVTFEYGDASLTIDEEDENGLDLDVTFSGPDFTVDFDTSSITDGDTAGDAITYDAADAISTSEHGLITFHVHGDADDAPGDAFVTGAGSVSVDVSNPLGATELDGLDTVPTALTGTSAANNGIAVAMNERDENGDSTSPVVALYEHDDASGLDSDTDVGEITEVLHWAGGSEGAIQFDFDADQDETITDYGSHVSFGDASEAVVTHATSERNHEVAIGETEATEGTSGETYEAVADQDDLPAMAQLDSDVTESVRDNNHLILVGGPAVNTLTEELYDDGDLDLSELEDQQSGAVLEVVEDAFSSGQHALVVAGYAADDTRSASQYLAQHRTNADALADADNRLVLSEADYPTEQ